MDFVPRLGYSPLKVKRVTCRTFFARVFSLRFESDSTRIKRIVDSDLVAKTLAGAESNE